MLKEYDFSALLFLFFYYIYFYIYSILYLITIGFTADKPYNGFIKYVIIPNVLNFFTAEVFMNSSIILASSSPRRIEMLKNNGIEPIIIPSSVDESLPWKLSMEQTVMYLALKKALNVEKQLLQEKSDLLGRPSVIIAADTIVYKDDMIGKPVDKADAERILKLLRNTSHYVATGVALIRPGDTKRSAIYEVTEVLFKNYSDDEIIRYIDTKEPWDKAGAYAIQGYWGKHVSKIIGSYDNVMGFPWELIKYELKKNWAQIVPFSE